jgi:DNA repair exonuclease SbcCD ATPase subunit
VLVPVSLTVQGFRGFAEEQAFKFPTPATVLFGENHCGKSSTLNALEWCLYGEECKGVGTNIRERIGWQIPNRHVDPEQVTVELRMSSPKGELLIRRSLHRSGKKRSLESSLEIECPDGESASGVDAEQLLGKWLRTTFRDFSTTVYQHQETIRGIVTQEPRERNDAIDRLIGLSDYRNLLDGIAKADAKGSQSRIGVKCDVLEGRIGERINAGAGYLEQSRRDAEAAGIPRTRHTPATALDTSRRLLEDLQTFVKEIGLTPLTLTNPERWEDLPAFETAVSGELRRLRSSLPDQDEQSNLYQRLISVNARLNDYSNLKGRRVDISNESGDLDRNHTSRTQVNNRLAEIALRLQELKAEEKEISGRQQVIVEAVAYLEEGPPEQAARCPVCDTETADLLPNLRSRLQDVLQGKLRVVQKESATLQTEKNVLDTAANKYKTLDGRLSACIADNQETTKKVGELFERTLTNEDDPIAILNAEKTRIDNRSQELTDLIGARQDRLGQIDTQLGALRCLRDVLQKVAKQEVIERIKETAEFDAFTKARDRLNELVSDIEAIKQAVASASNDDADRKIAAASATIDKYFRELTRHPAVTKISLGRKDDAKGRNAYSIIDQDGNDLAPILSQGDLNSLALAIFLGLASAGGTTAPMGFVMLDDPSQSMGAEHKRNLAGVLDQVCGHRRVLLATMDGEFRTCLGNGLTKTKTEYVFENWHPATGPAIRPPQ